MIEDLRSLFDAVPEGTRDAYRAAVIDDNALLKQTARTRTVSWKYLQRLYSFEGPTFQKLAALRRANPDALPLLALLLGLAHDHRLRDSAEYLLPLPQGTVIDQEALRRWMTERWGPASSTKTRISMGQNLLSSWAQAGHLQGVRVKRRTRATPTPEAVAFALYLGYLEGERGVMLYRTAYAQALDVAEGELDDLAYRASTLGYLGYRRIADVLEITFRAA